MKRRLFTILAALSLLLCLATVALWARSYWWYDGLAIARANLQTYVFKSANGTLFALASPKPLAGSAHWYFESRPVPTDAPWNFGDFGYRRSPPPHPNVMTGIWFPHWFLALLFAILPTCWLIGFQRSRRVHREGLCPKCGYDLRATPDKCPECGTIPVKIDGPS